MVTVLSEKSSPIHANLKIRKTPHEQCMQISFFISENRWTPAHKLDRPRLSCREMSESHGLGGDNMGLFNGGGFNGIALILVLFVLLTIVGVDD